MAFIMVTSRYPFHKAEEMGQAFIGKKVPEVADFVKRINIWVVSDFDVKIYALYECPNEKMYDALKSISTRYAGYRIIEGFKFKLEPLLTVQEALPMIGLGKK